MRVTTQEEQHPRCRMLLFFCFKTEFESPWPCRPSPFNKGDFLSPKQPSQPPLPKGGAATAAEGFKTYTLYRSCVPSRDSGSPVQNPVPSLAFSLLPLLLCVPYFPVLLLLRFTSFTDNAPKRFFKLRTRNEHPMAAAHALQPDVHARTHDLPTVTAARMRFFHFHYIPHVHLDDIHAYTPYPTKANIQSNASVKSPWLYEPSPFDKGDFLDSCLKPVRSNILPPLLKGGAATASVGFKTGTPFSSVAPSLYSLYSC